MNPVSEHHSLRFVVNYWKLIHLKRDTHWAEPPLPTRYGSPWNMWSEKNHAPTINGTVITEHHLLIQYPVQHQEARNRMFPAKYGAESFWLLHDSARVLCIWLRNLRVLIIFASRVIFWPQARSSWNAVCHNWFSPLQLLDPIALTMRPHVLQYQGEIFCLLDA